MLDLIEMRLKRERRNMCFKLGPYLCMIMYNRPDWSSPCYTIWEKPSCPVLLRARSTSTSCFTSICVSGGIYAFKWWDMFASAYKFYNEILEGQWVLAVINETKAALRYAFTHNVAVVYHVWELVHDVLVAHFQVLFEGKRGTHNLLADVLFFIWTSVYLLWLFGSTFHL